MSARGGGSTGRIPGTDTRDPDQDGEQGDSRAFQSVSAEKAASPMAPLTKVKKNEGKARDYFPLEARGRGKAGESVFWNILNLRRPKFVCKRLNLALVLGSRAG